ncbi:MAG TPA: TetR/AcrR family transcriptional regulator [Bacteroidales bacterium]|nr:TetR/AcrR family transcriptional regulator [Bacteroidales bacterium]
MDNKQRIIEEAAFLFRTYGIRTVTMDMLASKLGISKRTIYEIFSDKDEILDGVVGWMMKKQQEVIQQVLSESDNVIEALFRIMDLMTVHYHMMSPAFRLDLKRMHGVRLEKLRDLNEMPDSGHFRMIIERGVREGIFREDIDVSVINRCMFEVGKMSASDDISPTGEIPAEEVMRNVYLNYLRGISTPKGLDLINFYEKRENNRN